MSRGKALDLTSFFSFFSEKQSISHLLRKYVSDTTQRILEITFNVISRKGCPVAVY
jgi:hypothetical protein